MHQDERSATTLSFATDFVPILLFDLKCGMPRNNVSKSFTIAALLILLGSLPAAVFRLSSSSGFGAAVLVVGFSRSSPLNTSEEYRFNEHGRIVGIRRKVYERAVGWALGALILQGMLWMPALAIFARLYRERTALDWRGLALLVVGVLIWLASEASSFL